MAKHESDREDLMVEATAYKHRIEFCIDADHATCNQPIFCGFRKDDVLAIYFDQDPMFQFNEAGQLRRALVDGDLYRAQGSTLSKMCRIRTQSETRLDRTDLNEAALSDFLNRMDAQLAAVVAAITDDNMEVKRCITTDSASELLQKVLARLQLATMTNPRVAPPINVTR